MDKKSFENVRYFFSLVLEDYFGDEDELMEMAEITEEMLEDFFTMKFEATT